jgi:hypothetical protein
MYEFAPSIVHLGHWTVPRQMNGRVKTSVGVVANAGWVVAPSSSAQKVHNGRASRVHYCQAKLL